MEDSLTKTSETSETQPPNTLSNSENYEFNSFRNSVCYSNYYFGLNILDFYDEKTLKNMICDPIANNETLRKISLMLYGQNGVYTNTVDYMTAMPCLSKVVVAHGNNEKKKRKNKELMHSALRTIKDVEFVRDALFKGMVEGVAFYYFETTKMPNSKKQFLSDYEAETIYEINDLGLNASIISLPADYTKIVGRKNSLYVLAFNLDYFDEATGESIEQKLRKFPKDIREGYEKRKKNGLTTGNWLILDCNKTIVHKIRSKREEIWGRPLVLAAINDILYSDYFTTTKRNVLDEVNNRIIYQTFPEGQNKGTSALNKSQQQAQHDAVKGAVMNKNNRGGISFFSVASGTKIQTIDANNTDIFDEKYEGNLSENIAMDLGIASSLLSGSGSGSYSSQENNLELLSSQLFQWIAQIETELNKCISENIIKDRNNWVEVKYLPVTHANKNSVVSHAKELYLEGSGSISFWIAACGIEPDTYFALLDEELENDIYDKYPVHQTAYTTSSSDQGGRPTSEDSTNPSTLQTRANNSNNTPKPSTA